MTRNEYIAIISVQAHGSGFWDDHLQRAIQKADEIEAHGCAPWLDTPIQSELPGRYPNGQPIGSGYKVNCDPSDMCEGGNCDLNGCYKPENAKPEYRKITKDDLVPGVVLTDADGYMWTIIAFSGGDSVLVMSQDGEEGNRYVHYFLHRRNEEGAIITFPTQKPHPYTPSQQEEIPHTPAEGENYG